MKENDVSVRDVALDFGVSQKAVYCWFNGCTRIPINELIKLVDLVNAELVIRDKDTHEVICGNVSESDLKILEEREQLYKIKQALSVLSDFLK